MGAPELFDRNVATGAPVGTLGGTTNTIPRWTGPSTLGDSGLIDDGSVIYTTARNAAFGSTSSAGYRARVLAAAGAGSAFGLRIDAGTNSTDYALRIANQATTSDYLAVRGDGNVGIGTASPVNHGAGAVTLAINGTSLSMMDWMVNGTRTMAGFAQAVISQFGTVTSSPLAFLTANTERARIDSAGRFGIGTASPDSTLHVVGAASSQLRIGFNGLSQNYYDAGDHFFRSAGGVANRMSITSAFVDVSFAGYGLKLPATPGNTDPNTLDAYVDGGTAAAGGASFTATLKGSTTDPTTPVTTTGKYVLVGKVLTMSIYFDNANTTGASGDVIIETNLAAALRPQMRSVGQVGIYNFNAVGLGTFADARTDGKIYIMCNQNNNVWTAATHSAGAGRYLLVTVTFIIG